MEFSRQELLEWVAISFSRGVFLTQRLNLSLLCLQHCRQILYHCATWEAPIYLFLILCIYFWLYHVVCAISVPRPRVEPMPSALGAEF